MNNTQRGTWGMLAVSIFFIVFGILLFTEIMILRSWFIYLHKFIALILACFIVPYLIFIFKRQSPAEVESDERDRLIMKRAVLISFVSTWILLAAGCIIPRFVVGYEGCIPIWVISLVSVCIFMASMFIYSCAVLIQYIWGGKDGQE